MRSRIIALVLGAAALAAPALAQTSPLMLPPAVEKDLAARASEVTEVTLNKNMLGFASKFMDGKDKDQESVRQLIQGLDGIYVRDYEFDKEDQYSMDDLDKLRQSFATSEWSSIVHTRERGEVTDILVKLVNGEPHGMFILSAERRELSIVLILGPIRLDQLSQLNGIAGLSALSDVAKTKDGNEKEKAAKDKAKTKEDKDKTKDKKDGAQ